jgi:hypothetical protein
VTLVKRRSTWDITSKTSSTNPNDTPWSSSGQGLVKILVKPLELPWTPVSPGTFAAFSQFHLNTSNSPNTKVVYFVEGNNLYVEWHCWFEVQIGEKCRSTPPGTIHWSRDFCIVPLYFMRNPLIKTLYSLCKSGSGSADLQLWYRLFVALPLVHAPWTLPRKPTLPALSLVATRRARTRRTTAPPHAIGRLCRRTSPPLAHAAPHALTV